MKDQNSIENIVKQEILSAISCPKSQHVKLRRSAKEEWSIFLRNNAREPARLSNNFIDYQIEYDTHAIDLSIVVQDAANTVACILALIAKQDLSGWSLYTPSGPLFLTNLSAKTLKMCTRTICTYINRLALVFDTKRPFKTIVEADGSRLNYWQRRVIEAAEDSKPTVIGYLDIQSTYEITMNQLQKKIRYEVRNAARSYSVKIYESINECDRTGSDWESFKDLHFKAAGRQTRSETSWALQKNSINENKDFLALLFDQDDTLIGGAYIIVTKYEAIYAVAAYDRDRFNEGAVGHALQAEIIRKLVDLRVTQYELGQIFSSKTNSAETEKLLGISVFKSKFCSRYALALEVSCDTSLLCIC